MPPVRERDNHTAPTPRVGGMAVVGAFLLITLSIYAFFPGSFHFTDRLTWGIDRNLLGMLLAVLLLAVVNAVDDYRSAPVWIRLGVEVLAALMVLYFGVRVPWLSNPLGGKIILGSFEALVVVLWLVGLSNVTNWLDGVDGLASGVGLIALIVLFFLSASKAVDQPQNALVAAIAAGAVAGFLPFNIYRPQAFLGDTGSVFIGFLIGVLAIISGGKIATAFLVLAIPFLDAIVVFSSRLLHHKSPFKADRTHLHHRLLTLGLKSWQIVIIFYAISLLFGLIALNTQTIGKAQAAMAALVLMAFLVVLYSVRGKNEQTR